MQKIKKSHFGNIVISIHLLRHDSLHLKTQAKTNTSRNTFSKGTCKRKKSYFFIKYRYSPIRNYFAGVKGLNLTWTDAMFLTARRSKHSDRSHPKRKEEIKFSNRT
jgi:hypothetical protein